MEWPAHLPLEGGGVVSDVEGSAGGILVFWDKRVVELVDMETGIFSVSCCFRNCIDGFQWMFSGVYGPVVDSKREVFLGGIGCCYRLMEWALVRGWGFQYGSFPWGSQRGWESV